MAITPLQRIGPFSLGMDNRVPDFALKLPGYAGHLLRDALNVDVTQRGSLKTRLGQTLALAGVNCHSAWAPIGAAFGLYCDGGTIYRFDLDAAGAISRSVVATGFGITTPVVYA